jgi:hypothetical protein
MKKQMDSHNKPFLFLIAAQEIATWFNSAAALELVAVEKDNPFMFFQTSFQSSVGVQSINSGRQYNKIIYLHVPVGEKKYEGEGTWKGHDWDLDETDPTKLYTTTMCVQSALVLWKVLVGGREWRKSKVMKDWRHKEFDKILVNNGSIAEQMLKQKTRQRVFYARVDDFLEAPPAAKYIKWKNAYLKFDEMGWVKTGEKNWHYLMKKSWDRWNFNSINVVRAGTDYNYNKATKTLVERLNMRVEKIESTHVEFLRKLFT